MYEGREQARRRPDHIGLDAGAADAGRRTSSPPTRDDRRAGVRAFRRRQLDRRQRAGDRARHQLQARSWARRSPTCCSATTTRAGARPRPGIASRRTSRRRSLDYDIRKGTTYWYFTGTPLYPFGHGLSYSTFTYANLTAQRAQRIRRTRRVTRQVGVDVTNSGAVAGDEVVQLYVAYPAVDDGAAPAQAAARLQAHHPRCRGRSRPSRSRCPAARSPTGTRRPRPSAASRARSSSRSARRRKTSARMADLTVAP